MSGITLHVMLHRKTHRTNTSSLQAALLLPDRGFELHSVGAGRVPKDLEGCKFIKVCRPPLSLPGMLAHFASTCGASQSFARKSAALPSALAEARNFSVCRRAFAKEPSLPAV